jgi:UDP-N-acetyl-D-mannosaminuronic acid dehydrogenase
VEFNKICVLGLGYIGLPTASTFATHGINVVGVDVNNRIVETLKNGDIHIHEPGLRTLVQAALGSRKLTISTSPEPSDAFIISVPTPFLEDKRADMSYVIAAAQAIVPFLRSGNLVVLESTSPPRTTIDIVAPILERSGLKTGDEFSLAYSPERVLPGQILRELIENARVIGGIDSKSSYAGRDLYRVFVRGDIILTDATTAEMVKLMENTYRDVNIAIANEFSRLADRFRVDIWRAIEIANLHPRVDILKPGSGVGGHCIGVDPWFLVEAAPDITSLIRTARQVNDSQPEFVVKTVTDAYGSDDALGLSGSHIAILGLTYKPDVDDLRESPAISIAKLLVAAGALVSAYDPYQLHAEIEDVLVQQDIETAIKKADLLLLLVGHTSFKELDPEEIAEKTNARLIVDIVNVLNANDWVNNGFKLFRLGSPHTQVYL